MDLYHGHILYSKSRDELAVFENSKVGSFENSKVGSFEKGCRFDALVIDGVSDPFMKLSPVQTVERFCYTGTKDRIIARFLDGFQI